MMNQDTLIRIYKPSILCDQCEQFYADWELTTTGKYYCSTCVRRVTVYDLERNKSTLVKYYDKELSMWKILTELDD